MEEQINTNTLLSENNLILELVNSIILKTAENPNDYLMRLNLLDSLSLSLSYKLNKEQKEDILKKKNEIAINTQKLSSINPEDYNEKYKYSILINTGISELNEILIEIAHKVINNTFGDELQW